MRNYSLAFLTASSQTPPRMVAMAAQLGYRYVGLRLLPNTRGGPYQPLLGDAATERETLAAMRDTNVAVFDLEIIRIGTGFDPRTYEDFLETGARLKARSVLVACDDTDVPRLTDSYARLCELMLQYGLNADVEFMPWTAVPDAASALLLYKAAGSPPNGGILVDALHAGRSCTTLEDLASLPRKALHYAQVCDAQAGTHFTTDELIWTARSERLLPLEGNIDLTGIFGSLPQDLPLSVEIPNDGRVRQVGELEWSRQALVASRQALG